MVVNGYRSACFAHPSRGPNVNRRSLHKPPTRSCKPWDTSLTKDRDFDPRYKSLGPPNSKPRKKARPWNHGPWKPGGLNWDMIEGFTGIGAPQDEKEECETLKQRRKDFRTAIPLSKIYSHRDLLVASEHEIQLQEYIAENRHLPEYHDHLGKKKRALVQKKIMPKAPHHSHWNPGLPVDKDFTEQKNIGCVEYDESNLRMSKHLAKVRVEKQSYAQDLYETESGVYGISRNPSGVSTKSSFVSIVESSPRTIVSSKKTTPRQQVIVVPERPRLPIRSFRDIPMPQTSGSGRHSSGAGSNRSARPKKEVPPAKFLATVSVSKN